MVYQAESPRASARRAGHASSHSLLGAEPQVASVDLPRGALEVFDALARGCESREEREELERWVDLRPDDFVAAATRVEQVSRVALVDDLLHVLRDGLVLRVDDRDEAADERLDRLFAGVGAREDVPFGDAERANAAWELCSELRAELGLDHDVALREGSLPQGALALSTPGEVRLSEDFDPKAPEGRALLAHELTHEAQRSVGGVGDVAAAEREAEAVMVDAFAGRPLTAPSAALPAGAAAACGPRAMAEARERAAIETLVEEEKKDDTPDPERGGERPTGRPRRGIEYAVEVPEPIIEVPVADTPPAPEGGSCELGCPDPLPEHVEDLPVREPLPEPPAGDGEVRTLVLAGHVIRLRLPTDARPGQIRVRFRDADSPYGAMVLRTAVLTLDERLEIVGGTLHVDVRLGRFVEVRDAELRIERGGRIALSIRDARLRIGDKVKAKVDLDIDHRGVSGAGVISARDLSLGSKLRVSDALLAVEVSRGGAVRAHGLIGIEVIGLGKVEVEACLVDGVVRGKVTATWTRPFPIGIGRVRRVSLSGCYDDGAFTLHGEVDMTVRDWLFATAKADLERNRNGELTWGVEADLHQTKPIALGQVALHDTHVHAAYRKGEWEPATIESHFRVPRVMGTLKGTIDLERGLVSGQGDAQLVEAIRVGPVTLDEGLVVAKVVDNELVTVTGSTSLLLSRRGVPAFEVRCEEAIWDVTRDEVHARGVMEVLRDVTFGDTAGLHTVITRGPAGTFTIEHGRVANLAAEVAAEVRRGVEVVGRGLARLDVKDGEAFAASVTFDVVGRWGLPAQADGPLFLLPGGRMSFAMRDDQAGPVKAEGVGWELVHRDGPGRVCGQVDGHWDFTRGEGALAGMAFVHEPWVLETGLGTMTIGAGNAPSDLQVKVGKGGIERLSGKVGLAIDGAKGPLSALGGYRLEGFGRGRLDPVSGRFDGDYEVALREGRMGLPAVGPYRLCALSGTSFKGRIEGATPVGAVETKLVLSLERDGQPFMNGSLEGGRVDLTTGHVSGLARVSPSRELDAASLGWRLPGGYGARVQAGSAMSLRLEGGVPTELGGALAARLDRFGVEVADVALDFVLPLGGALTGTGRATMIADQVLVPSRGTDTNPAHWGVTLVAGSAVELSVIDGALTSCTVKVDAVATRGNTNVAALAIEGMWRFGEGVPEGRVTAELLEDAALGEVGQVAWSLARGSRVAATIAGGGLSALSGEVTLLGVVGGAPLLQATVSGTWDGSIRSLDATGRGRVMGRHRVLSSSSGSVWLVPDGPSAGSSLAVVIEGGRLVALSGAFSVEVHDARGPLFSAGLEGTWSPDTRGLDGEGRVELLRTMVFPEGGHGPRVELLEGTRGTGRVSGGRVVSMEGELALRLLDEQGPMAHVAGRGRLVEGAMLAEARGVATLLRPLEVKGGDGRTLARLTQGRASAEVQHGMLVSLAGAFELEVPGLGQGARGGLVGQWRPGRGGRSAAIEGSGWLALTLLEDPRRGRRLGGRVAVTVAGPRWNVQGMLDFQLMHEVGGRVGVTLDERLEPIVDVALRLERVRLAAGRSLLQRQLDLVPRLTVGAVPVSASFGVTAGIALGMRDLTASGKVEASGWAPLHEALPRFEAELGLEWGLDLKAMLFGWMQAQLGVPWLANVSAGLLTSLVAELPVTLMPRAVLRGGPDGLSGELDIGVTLRPRLAVELAPYLSGQVFGFDLGKAQLARWQHDLGSPVSVSWGASYTFGDGPLTSRPRPASEVVAAKPTSRTVNARQEARPELAELAPREAGLGPGLPVLGDEVSLVGEPSGGPGQLKELDQLMAAVGLVGDLACAAERYLGLLTSFVGYQLDGSGRLRVHAAWEEVAVLGRRLVAVASEVVDMRYTMPLWVKRIIDAPPGMTPGPLAAWNDEDDHARALIEGGAFGALPLAGRVQLIKALMRGSCGDEDEEAILKVVHHAKRHGEGRALVDAVGVGALRKAFDGAEREALEALLASLGGGR